MLKKNGLIEKPKRKPKRKLSWRNIVSVSLLWRILGIIPLPTLLKRSRLKLRSFLAAIKKSKVYPVFLEDCVKETAEDPDLYDGPWTAKELDRFIQINEGINGWEESIEVVHNAPQEVNVLLMPITDDLATMLKIRFKNWITGVSTGDGDEGHIYYQI